LTAMTPLRADVALVIGDGVAYQHAPQLRNPPDDASDVGAALARDGIDVTVATDLGKVGMEEVATRFSGAARTAQAQTSSPEPKPTASSIDQARVVDKDPGWTLTPQTGHSSEVCAVAISPDGNRIVSGSADNSIKIWDARSGALLRTLQGHSRS